MGSLKDKALKQEPASEDTQVHELTNDEISLIRSLNISLKFHTLGQQILSQFLFMIATYRLDYPAQSNLQFWFDFDDLAATELTITLLPAEPAPST